MSEDEFTKKLEEEYRRKEERWRHRIKRSEDLTTVDGAMDLATANTLFNMLEREILIEVTGVLSTGKESTIYLGLAKGRRKVAIKTYRTKTLDFKKVQQYLDARFTRLPKKSHKFMEIWAEKEFKNLKRNFNAGVRIPEPLAVKRNVLVMEFIGTGKLAAPQIRQIELENYQEICEDIVHQIRLMYQKANLVHADLSEYNILYLEQPWIIDCSQSVLKSHPMANQLLYRDLENILSFFEVKGVDIPDISQLYEELTGEKLDPLTKQYFD
ncbi:MAG: serine protein kinase RIO [Promethearchaeota archaeon]